MGLARKGGIHFGERVDIPDVRNPAVTYLTRWILLRTTWFSIYLHRIEKPDQDRHLHDHPWNFISIVLLGGYVEERPDSIITRRSWLSVARRRASDLHRIRTLLRTPTWTLVFRGRDRRCWGFATESGWIDHEAYFA